MKPDLVAPLPFPPPSNRLPSLAGSAALAAGSALIVHALCFFDVGSAAEGDVFVADFERVSMRQSLVTLGSALLVAGSIGLSAAHSSRRANPRVASIRIHHQQDADPPP